MLIGQVQPQSNGHALPSKVHSKKRCSRMIKIDNIIFIKKIKITIGMKFSEN